jgi:hypothetical protein
MNIAKFLIYLISFMVFSIGITLVITIIYVGIHFLSKIW